MSGKEKDLKNFLQVFPFMYLKGGKQVISVIDEYNCSW